MQPKIKWAANLGFPNENQVFIYRLLGKKRMVKH